MGKYTQWVHNTITGYNLNNLEEALVDVIIEMDKVIERLEKSQKTEAFPGFIIVYHPDDATHVYEPSIGICKLPCSYPRSMNLQWLQKQTVNYLKNDV